MSPYVAFLRGMNLGGRRITNEDLRRHLEALGLGQVSTFRASGNVIFEAAGRASEQKLQAQIEAGLAKALSYEVPTFIRTMAHVAEIAASEPFKAAQVKRSKGKLQVALLHSPPPARARREVLALAGDDALAFGRRELFWLPPAGLSQSELDLKAIERALGPMTVRTMGTVAEIATKHGEG